MKKSVRRIIIAASVLMLFLAIYLYYINTNEREIISEGDITVTENAKDFHISTNGIMIFDNNLYILDKDANLIKTVMAKDIKLTPFMVNNYAFLYDEDTGRVSQYQDNGEFIRTIKISDTLFNVTYNNRNIVFHTKFENGERLWTLGLDGSLNKVYETANTILVYDYEDKNKFAVAELKVETNGYTTLCTVHKPSETKTYNQSAEVGLFVDYFEGRTVLVTNKNLYSFEKGAENKVNIPNVSAVEVIDRDVYLLHSGVLSKYNSKLKEVKKHIVAANVENMLLLSKSLYAYSKTDIAGNLMQRDEYYFRFPEEVEKVEVSGIRIGTLKDGIVSLYKITNRRNNLGEI